jgi:hypothetical protein
MVVFQEQKHLTWLMYLDYLFHTIYLFQIYLYMIFVSAILWDINDLAF